MSNFGSGCLFCGADAAPMQLPCVLQLLAAAGCSSHGDAAPLRAAPDGNLTAAAGAAPGRAQLQLLRGPAQLPGAAPIAAPMARRSSHEI